MIAIVVAESVPSRADVAVRSLLTLVVVVAAVFSAVAVAGGIGILVMKMGSSSSSASAAGAGGAGFDEPTMSVVKSEDPSSAAAATQQTAP